MKKVLIFFFFNFLFALVVFAQQDAKGSSGMANANIALSSLQMIPTDVDPDGFPYTFLAADTVDFSDSIPDEELMYFADKLKDRAVQLENIIIQNKQRLEYARKLLEDDLSKGKKEKTLDSDAQSKLKNRISAMKKEEKRLAKSRSKAEKIAAKAVAVAESSVEEVREKLPDVRNEIVTLAEMTGRSRDWVDANLSIPTGGTSKNEAVVPVVIKRNGEADLAEKTKEKEEKAAKNQQKTGKSKKNDPVQEVETVLVEEVEMEDLSANDTGLALSDVQDEMDEPKQKKSKKSKKKKKGENEVVEEEIAEEAGSNEIQERASDLDGIMGIREGEQPNEYVELPVYTNNPNRYLAYDPSFDVMRNPPQRPCSLAVNKIDEFSGKILKQTTEEELFRFTNDFMRPHLNGKPHILCKASMSQLGEVVTINLTFYIRDNNAKRAFGGIRRNNVMTLRFIDDDNKSTPNFKEETNLTEEGGAVTIYKGQFPVDRAILKKVENSELDKIRIQWNAGYEDYEIFNIDLLMQQAKCLSSQ